ncbi:MAG: hypothetical protein AAB696_01305 [Patescibacteria group bacterium]
MQNQKGNITLIIVGIAMLLIIGGGVGYFIIEKSIQKEEQKIVQQNQSKEEVKQKQEPQVYINYRDVYYINETGNKKIIAQSIKQSKNSDGLEYVKASLSPNKKFIMLGVLGWESVSVYIYDIDTGNIYNTKQSSSSFGNWLSDSRLQIIGECGMGISCGKFESINNIEPWNLKEIKDETGLENL